MLELCGMPSLPGPLLPRVVAPERVLSMGQRELNCVLMLTLRIRCTPSLPLLRGPLWPGMVAPDGALSMG